MARRPVALAAAIVLFVEAVSVALLHWVLGLFVEKQTMSLAGLDPRAMTVGTWVAGLLFGLYLALCGLALLRSALRDRAPGRFGRALLISAAVVHAVLGALVIGLAGWPAFGFMMLVLGLIVLSLLAYGKGSGKGVPATAPPAPQP